MPVTVMPMTMPMCADPEVMPGAMLRLWQLISPASPVGAYAYSSGLEAAIEQGWVATAQDLQDWVGGVMAHGLACLDVPLLVRFHAAWQQGDAPALQRWSAFLRAARESAELEQEDRQLGSALARLLDGLGIADAAAWRDRDEVSYPCMFALAAARWRIDRATAAQGYLWAWCENQVTAAMKLMPLGQTAGQQVLTAVAGGIPAAATDGMERIDADVGMQLHGLAIASARHETQYSRLFRS